MPCTKPECVSVGPKLDDADKSPTASIYFFLFFTRTKHTHTTSLSVCVSISEEGGHPDGSPLLRFSEKQTQGHGGKKALVSLYAEGSGHDEEYSGGQQRTVMIIRAPFGFADHVSFTEKKRGKSRGGASSGATPSGAGPGMYQDLNESYAFSFCDDDDDHYTSVS